ncbi:hypothetical protein HR11_02720 [Porphyromonas macacae]|uniref:BACON domain-containing protein n=1 Tax=Porphyromonas macacae TaxID=28115 RepID=UPI00052D7C21|nr:BACON domain-containing carbohydrate-binding protein [Porphyromonas macacae]KGN99220.1 hypothetical protein HR11_02720 [Porphyromonas macacae]
MIRKALILIFSSVLFLLGSCTRADLTEGDTLSFSESELLKFSHKKAMKEISILTNKAHWSFVKNADWIEVEAVEKTLVLHLSENKGTEMRTAHILVRAGTQSRKLTVEQFGSTVISGIEPRKIETDQWGGEFKVDILSDVDDWEVLNEAPWITTVLDRFKNCVSVKVGENSAREARETKIYFRSKIRQELKELSILQKGIVYYLLPYLGFGDKAEKVYTFEYARRSDLISAPDGLTNLSLWTFKLTTPAFRRIIYDITKDKLVSALMITDSSTLLTDEEELAGVIGFLSGNGFEKFEKEERVYVDRKKNVKAKIRKKDILFTPIEG